MAMALPLHRFERRSAGTLLPIPVASAMVAVSLAAAVIIGFITYHGNDPGSVEAAVVRGACVFLPFAVGLAIWTRLPHPLFGGALVMGGVLTCLAALGGSDNEVVYSVGRIAGWLAELACVYLVLSFPTGVLTARVDRVLVASFAVVVLALFLPTVVMTEAYPVPAAWTTCVEGCPGNAFQLPAHEPGWVGQFVLPLREVLITLVLIAVSLRLLSRIAAATTPLRRTMTPVLAGAVIHTVALPVGLGLRRAHGGSDAVLTLTWVLAAGLPVLTLGFLVAAARWRLAVGAGLYRLAPNLHAGMDHEELRGALSESLEDPTIELVYRSADHRWLDGAGREVTLPVEDSRRDYTVISDGDARVAAIVHDQALQDHRTFVQAVGSLALMVLTNQRLAAEVTASLQEVRRSRERILTVADEERRRIERDLHDGAQQRLVALRIKLELARERSAEEHVDAEQLHQFGEDVSEALDEVRSLAAGVYPPLLVDCGLREALRSIARRSPMPVWVAAEGVGRFPRQVEAVVYFCCLEALQNAAKHAEASSVSIVVSDGRDLRFEVRDDGRGFDVRQVDLGHGLTNIRDRIVAVGGTLRVESRPGRGTRISGTIPVTQV